MKNKQELLEQIYEISQQSSESSDEFIKLFYDVVHNNISVADAEIKFRQMDPQYVRYEFLNNLKGKSILSNIKLYSNKELSDIDITKMISSLLTQVIIQKSNNKDISYKDLQVDLLLDILTEILINNNIDRNKIDYLINQYGWDDAK